MNKLQARNEMVINSPVSQIWEIITDISQLHKIHPGVVKTTGAWNEKNCTRTCEMINKGKKGAMTEKITEIIPEKKIIWTTERDTMGMRKMMKNISFSMYLEPMGSNRTKVINESYYKPANFLVSIMNVLMMKKMFSKTQEQILTNIKLLTEK